MKQKTTPVRDSLTALKVAKSSVLLLFLLAGCTTSFFKVKKEGENTTELLVTPDRILLQCEELDEEPDYGAYGFMIHFLDEENTVTTTALNIRPDKENCELMIREITSILKNGRSISIGNRIKLTKQSRTKEDRHFRYTFPGHGTFFSNGRSLDFVYIANEKGECFGPSYDDKPPCPRWPFPLKDGSP